MAFDNAIRDNRKLDTDAENMVVNISRIHAKCTEAKTDVAGGSWSNLLRIPVMSKAFDDFLTSLTNKGVSPADLAARVAAKYDADTTTFVADVGAVQTAFQALRTGIEANAGNFTLSYTAAGNHQFENSGDLTAPQVAAIDALLDAVLANYG